MAYFYFSFFVRPCSLPKQAFYRAACGLPGQDKYMDNRKKQRLTNEVHKDLIKKGYRYLLIQDVEYAKDGKTMASCTVKVIKDFPDTFPQSCTGIEDGMITSIINVHEKNVTIYIDAEEEL